MKFQNYIVLIRRFVEIGSDVKEGLWGQRYQALALQALNGTEFITFGLK